MGLVDGGRFLWGIDLLGDKIDEGLRERPGGELLAVDDGGEVETRLEVVVEVEFGGREGYLWSAHQNLLLIEMII